VIELTMIIAGSFLGSAHCIGMCGGLAGALGATRAGFWTTFSHQLVFTSGRIFTYSFLGAISGFAGLSLSQHPSSLLAVQQVFSALAGIIMLYVGFSALGLWPRPKQGSQTRLSFVQVLTAKLFTPLFNHFLNVRGRFGFFAAGLATGFLPCGLVYAFLAIAAAKSNPLHGLILMACFGLGTAPAMLLVGCGSHLLSHAVRVRVFRVAACFMLLMGAMTIFRALPNMHAAHHTTAAAMPAMGPQTTPSASTSFKHDGSH